MSQPLPTILFRYPGPCGLGALLGLGELATLGPPETDALWLCEAAVHRDVAAGVRAFGTLALLAPEAFAPTPAGPPGRWVGRNRPLRPDDDVLWVPPSRVAAPPRAAQLREAPDPTERERVITSLFDYLDELSALHRAGAPGPGVPWCQVSGTERRRLLEAWGVRPRWTDRHDREARAAA